MTTSVNELSTVVELFAAELYRILNDVLPSANKNRDVQVYRSIHLETKGNNMIAVATDGYTMSVSRARVRFKKDADGGPALGDLSFELDYEEAQALIRVARTKKTHTGNRTVTISRIRMTDVRFQFLGPDGETVKTVRPVEWDQYSNGYPDWRRLIPESKDGVARAVTGFDPDKLARFAHVEHVGVMQLVSHCDTNASTQKPWTVKIGENFIGLIMPVKIGGDYSADRWEAPDWLWVK